MRQEEHSHRTFVVCAQHAATNRTNVRPLCRRTSAKPTEAASLVRNGTRQQVARDGDACGAQASLGQVTTSNRVHSRDWSNAGTAHLCVFVLPRLGAARGWGLEVPSSNLGAPIAQSPASWGFCFRKHEHAQMSRSCGSAFVMRVIGGPQRLGEAATAG
jgi:hypothetical protein